MADVGIRKSETKRTSQTPRRSVHQTNNQPKWPFALHAVMKRKERENGVRGKDTAQQLHQGWKQDTSIVDQSSSTHPRNPISPVTTQLAPANNQPQQTQQQLLTLFYLLVEGGADVIAKTTTVVVSSEEESSLRFRVCGKKSENQKEMWSVEKRQKCPHKLKKK